MAGPFAEDGECGSKYVVATMVRRFDGDRISDRDDLRVESGTALAYPA
jgi:hypothetical protein